MSNISTVAASSGLAQMMQMQMQSRTPEPPLKDSVDGMSEEDSATFESNIESFSKEQMTYFISLMSSNESEISQMSQEEASSAILELMDTASSIEDLSEVEGLSALDALSDELKSGPAEGKGPPPPPPSNGEVEDPLSSLTQENMDTFLEMIESMSSEQKLEFGNLLVDSKEELSTMDAEEAAQTVLDLLEKASSTVTNSSTQSATQNFRRGGDFLDIYS